MISKFIKYLCAIVCVFMSTSITPVFASNRPMNLSQLSADINLKENGLAAYSINIYPTYTEDLDWNLGVKSVEKLILKADGIVLKRREYSLTREGDFLRIKVNKKFAGSWSLNFQNKDSITINDRDNLKWNVASGIHGYIDSLVVNLTTEVPFADNTRLSNRVYAFHGVAIATTEMIDNHSVKYSGFSVAPSAGFTTFSSWPKKSIKMSFIKRAKLSMANMPIVFWIFFGLLLPIFSLIFLTVLFIRNKKNILLQKISASVDKPPSDLPPLLLGILINNNINGLTLMAQILDFCQRKYIVIIKDGDQFVFGKRKLPDENMEDWESSLFGQLAMSDHIWTKESQIKKVAGKNLYSPEMKSIYDELFQKVADMGYYQTNPQLIEFGYKLIGIVFYLLSLIGLIWVATTMQSVYLLIPLLGVLFSATMIIRFAHLMPTRTEKGIQTREEWIKFKNFLKSDESIASTESISGTFSEYLPYAIIFKVEKSWANRFQNTIMPVPDWFIQKDVRAIEAQSTVNQVLGEVITIAERLNQLQGPNVR